jgi:hypothetical protein
VSRDLLSKATRNEFREAFVGFVLRDIDMMFDGAGLRLKDDFVPLVTGQRRSRVEQYYANVDFGSATDVAKVVSTYGELMERLLPKPGVHGGAFGNDELVERLLRRMKQDGFSFESGLFTSQKLRTASLAVTALVSLTEASITEHIDKARAKIEAGDHAGAITNTYTLVEEFLKELLRRSGTAFKADEGDIRNLYRVVAGALNLSPSGESLEGYLKSILQGLTGQVAGLFEVANKAGDRHARRYNPAKHHAKLAVNAAFTLCEFLLDSFRYQQERAVRTKP